MKYNEYLYKICSQADLSNEDEATELVQYLAKECAKNNDIALKYDDKLKEVMSAKDYNAWTIKTGKELFLKEANGMEDSPFKDFVLENMCEILGDAE